MSKASQRWLFDLLDSRLFVWSGQVPLLTRAWVLTAVVPEWVSSLGDQLNKQKNVATKGRLLTPGAVATTRYGLRYTSTEANLNTCWNSSIICRASISYKYLCMCHHPDFTITITMTSPSPWHGKRLSILADNQHRCNQVSPSTPNFGADISEKVINETFDQRFVWFSLPTATSCELPSVSCWLRPRLVWKPFLFGNLSVWQGEAMA